jgi:anti-sigma B factor antagonist
MSNPALTISSRTERGSRVIAPVGDVDLNAAPTLKAHLRTAHGEMAAGSRLVIDLAGVPYMDSSGLATLVESMQASRRTGFDLKLCNLAPRVRAIFEIAKLNRVFTIVPTLDDALAT